MALLETLQDNFSVPATSATKWTTTGTVNYTGGVAFMSGAATSNFDSQAAYDFDTAGTNSTYLIARVTRYGTGFDVDMQVYETPGSARAILRIDISGNLQALFYNSGGSLAYNTTIATYNASAMPHLRIRTASNRIYFAYSADRVTWTETSYSGTFAGTNPKKARFTHSGTAADHATTIDDVNIMGPYSALAAPTSINDPQTVPAPAAVNTLPPSGSPTSITDGETLNPPAAAIATAANPDSVTDTETATNPAVTTTTGATPDPIADTETLGSPATTVTAGVRLVETLNDDFGGTTLDPAKWTSSTTGTVISVAVAGGTLNMTSAASGSAGHSGTVTSVETFEIDGSALYAKVVPGAATSTPKTGIHIFGVGNGEEFHISREPTNLYFRGYNASGTQINNTFIAYNASSMAYWRMRFSAGNVYWETAPADNGPWTIRKQIVYTPAVHAYRVVLDMQWVTGTPGVCVSQFDNVNNSPTASVIDGETLPPPTLAPIAEPFTALSDDFSTMNQWTRFGFAVDVDVSSSRMNLTTSPGLSGASAPSGGVYSNLPYSLVESSLSAQVSTAGSAGNQSITLTVINPSNTKEYFHISKSSTFLWCRAFDINGTTLLSASITYVAATHAWWRIRHSAGILYFETSADNNTWAARQSCAYTPSMQAMRGRLETVWTGTSTATTVWFDNVNIDPKLRPDSITNVDTLGPPTITVPAPPTTPDGIGDPETLDLPEATFAAAGTNVPDSIEDTEEVPAPDLFATDDTAPDPIADSETLGDPTAGYADTITPDPLGDTETLGPPTPLLSDTTAHPDDITDGGTLGDVLGLVTPYPSYYPDSIIDIGLPFRPDSLIFREISNWNYGAGIYSDGPYSGSPPLSTPPDVDQTDNLTYGTGTYGYGIYYGTIPAPLPDAPEPQPLISDIAGLGQPPMHILGIGPWSPTIVWRGLPNFDIKKGARPARPALALPPATSKGFTLRLAEGSEARIDLAMQRGEAIVIDEMDTDLWWRRKDPRTKRLEVIGRFNCSHIELSTSDTGVNMSAQFEDYVTVLGARLVLQYLNPNDDPPTSLWKPPTRVTDILSFALPGNTGLDLSEVTGGSPYPLGNIIQPYTLPPGTSIADVMSNLIAISPVAWEWWIETPLDVNLPPKLRFALGQRGSDKGVTLLDAGSGPTPIAAWTKNGAADNYANALYYTGSGTGVGKDAGGGVVETIPAQIKQYGQRDAQYGSSTQGGVIAQIQAGAVRKLSKLSDRKPTYTITLTHGFWRGRNHIDVGDTITLILRLGKDVTVTKYRVTEIVVAIDDNGMEDVTLTLGKPRASNDPRSSQSPIMRMLRTLKNYEAPNGAAEIPPPEE